MAAFIAIGELQVTSMAVTAWTNLHAEGGDYEDDDDDDDDDDDTEDDGDDGDDIDIKKWILATLKTLTVSCKKCHTVKI